MQRPNPCPSQVRRPMLEASENCWVQYTCFSMYFRLFHWKRNLNFVWYSPFGPFLGKPQVSYGSLMDSYGCSCCKLRSGLVPWNCDDDLKRESPTGCSIYEPKLGIPPCIPVAYHICPPFKVVICGNMW